MDWILLAFSKNYLLRPLLVLVVNRNRKYCMKHTSSKSSFLCHSWSTTRVTMQNYERILFSRTHKSYLLNLTIAMTCTTGFDRLLALKLYVSIYSLEKLSCTIKGE